MARTLSANGWLIENGMVVVSPVTGFQVDAGIGAKLCSQNLDGDFCRAIEGCRDGQGGFAYLAGEMPILGLRTNADKFADAGCSRCNRLGERRREWIPVPPRMLVSRTRFSAAASCSSLSAVNEIAAYIDPGA